ncbi:FAD-dependent oxidoreductase [Actinomadura kijaniata]|uniref:FAD-dependent oxidoreductase n=1 Tax=Actinomadura kijaniata TaxID=46161 RepID=UPI003F19A354
MAELSRRKILAGAVVGGAALGIDGPASAATRPDGPGTGGNCQPDSAPVVVTNNDPRYPSLVTPWNTRFQGKPENVHLVHTAKQVADIVEKAVAAGKRIAVRGGGHSYENFTASPDIQVLIDLSQMSNVYYDARRRAFAVEGGAKLGQVYAALFKGWAVTVPAGVCPDVGVGGHIAGGGYGFLSRRYGLVVDHLYAVEVVVVDASGRSRIIVATRDEGDPHRDLWWAHTGGGGGNFGIVTRYWLRSPGVDSKDPARLLPRAPASMISRMLTLSWDKMPESRFARFLGNYCDWFENNGAPGSPEAQLWGGFFAYHRTTGQLGLIVGVDGGVPNARRLLDEHCGEIMSGVGVRPEADQFDEVPFLGDRNWVHEPYLRSKNKAADLRKGFSDFQTAAIYRRLNDSQNPNAGASLNMGGLGGQISRVPKDATASAGRDSILRIYMTAGQWSTPAEDQKNIRWIREFYRDLYSETGGVPVPNQINGGSYINYPDVDLADPAWNTSGVSWETIYYKSGYPRLQRIKKRYDPGNVFRHALSIRPK